MRNHISFSELPHYVRGTVWQDSTRQFGEAGVVIRGFDYGESDVSAPPLNDDFLAFYVAGHATATRRLGGPMQRAEVGPGSVSFLPRGVTGRWRWDGAIRVVHVYLPRNAVRRTCAAIASGDADRIELRDDLSVADPEIQRIVMEMTRECGEAGVGSPLYYETLAVQLSIHLLRRHFRNVGYVARGNPRLAHSQHIQIRDLIEDRLGERLTLAGLAGEFGMSESTFARAFRASYGVPIHTYVLDRRLARAKGLLADSVLSLAEVAFLAGFSHQSHLTRHFRRAFNTTPAVWRKAAGVRAARDRDAADPVAQA